VPTHVASPPTPRPSSLVRLTHLSLSSPPSLAYRKKSEILGTDIVAPSTLRATSPRPRTSDSVPRGTTYFFQDCFPFRTSCLLISCFTLDRLAFAIVPPVWYFLPLWPCPLWPPHVCYCLLISVRPSLRLSLFVSHVWVVCWTLRRARVLDFHFLSLVESASIP
jgi:hypothetical protein